MTPERWQRIDALLQEVIDRPPGERAAFLGEVCTDDATRIEIESLISFQEQADGFLEVPAFEAAADLVCEAEAGEMIGLLIGPYKIEALLGAGGMGEVYLAEDTKLGRKVAIKFLPTYLEANDVAKKRLANEAKAAGMLDHPNICTIYEVIEAASQSFIVMQYVRGETLAARIKREPLTLLESLDVAAQVADALAEAHARRIIHRDIKPQNLMLTDRAQVKVLDFGLAKVIWPAEMQTQAQSQLSMPGVIVGTAAYMSPEQAKGDTVDARSDLFSLGVVLYECLAGHAPFSGATAMEICVEVIHRDPPPPSRLNPQVPPELDAVVLKALAKDPAARYKSAADMLEALRATRTALQTGQPVPIRFSVFKLGTSAARALTALPGAWRRPRVFLPATLALLTIALLAFILISRLTPHQPLSAPQLSEAQDWYTIGVNALRIGAYYDASLALQKATAADDKFALTHALLAEAWIELGYADKANQELLRARSLIPNLSSLPQRERLYFQAITHVVLREFPAAIENYHAIAQAAPDAEKAAAYVDLGRAYEKNNEVEKALESYREAARLAPSDVAAFMRLGILYSARQQNLDSALEAFKKAEELYQALRNFEGVAEVAYRRGLLFSDLDQPSEAWAELEKAIDIAKPTGNHYQQIRALSVLSNVSVAQGNVAQARQQAEEAIALARANDIAHLVTSGFIWLGNTFLMRGEYGDAENYYRQGLDYAQRDREHLNEAWARMSLGSVNTLLHKTDEALRYLEQARPFYEQGGYRKWLALTLNLIGRAYRDKGDYETALRTFNDLLQQGEEANDLSQMALSHEEIGGVLAIREQYPEALGHYDESCKRNKELGAQFNFGYSVMHRGSVLWQLGRYDEARAALDEASAIAKRPDGTYNHLLASIYIVAGCLELSEWHFQESQTKCRQALSLAGTQYRSTAVQAKYTLGLMQTRSGAPRAGLRLCKEAVKMARATGDPQLLADAWLASAEAMLESGQAQGALESALQAQQSFARFEQQDSEWRAWLIAARARRQSGEEATARAYAQNAAARLSSLEQRWGQEAFSFYRLRPDVKHFLNQLGQISNPQL